MNIPTTPLLETPRLRLIRITDPSLSGSHLQWFHETWSDPIATSWSLHGKCSTLEESHVWFTEQLTKMDNIIYIVFAKVSAEGETLPYPGKVIGNVGLRKQSSGPGLPPFAPPKSSSSSSTDSPAMVLNLRSIGYFFLPAAWGKGYATEAVRAVLDAYREWANRVREKSGETYYVEAIWGPENAASGRVLGRLGFTDIGYKEAPEKAWLAGGWRYGYNVSGLYI